MEKLIKTGRSPEQNAQFLKQRKFMVIVPLLVLPFMTVCFWALGGGTGNKEPSESQVVKGLNTSLPKAQFKNEKSVGKMGLYQHAQQDSASQVQDGISSAFAKEMSVIAKRPDTLTSAPNTTLATIDENEANLRKKLAEINRQISAPEPASKGAPTDAAPSEDVARLHRMMKSMNGSSHGDPEMRQLDQMLERIQNIQNPGSVKTKHISKTSSKPFKAIPAIVDGKQKVMDGAVVRLKLTDSVVIKNQRLKKGQLLFGACQITNQRLLLTIQNIRNDNNIIPVDLTVFSQDGMPGIPAPEAEFAGSASSGAESAVQSMQFLTMDQSIGAQAAAGGVNAAKNLFSKKIKKLKIKLKDGFPVLLRINK